MWKATQCTDQTRALQQSSPWILSAAVRRMTSHFPHQCARYRFELSPTMTQATRMDRLKAAESRKERRMEQKVSRRRWQITDRKHKAKDPAEDPRPKKYVSALVKEKKCPDYSQSKSNKGNKNNGKCKAKEALEEPSPKSSLETKYLDRWQAKTNKHKVLCEEELPEVENEKFSAYSNSKSDSSKKLAPEVAASRSWNFRSTLQLRRKTSAPICKIVFRSKNENRALAIRGLVQNRLVVDDVDLFDFDGDYDDKANLLHQENLRAMEAMPMNSLLSLRVFEIRAHLRHPELNPPDIYDSEYPKADSSVNQGQGRIQDFKEVGRKEKKGKISPKKTQRGPKSAAKPGVDTTEI
ncbi:hypothetical protein B0H19DRAFT_1085789 [Mycena capillaripes]|nr:hypothetical protein B0H19DRAFT_1085789 [Mycena capillaripes]